MLINLVASSLKLKEMFVFQRIFRISITMARPFCWLNLGTGTGKVAMPKVLAEVVVAGTVGPVTESRYSCGLTSPVPPVSPAAPARLFAICSAEDEVRAPERYREMKFPAAPNWVPT